MFHPSTRPAGHGITIGNPRRYVLFGALFFLGQRRRAYRTLMAAAEVKGGDRVLNVGSGPGCFARLLAAAVGRSRSVTGLDAAPEMASTRRAAPADSTTAASRPAAPRPCPSRTARSTW